MFSIASGKIIDDECCDADAIQLLLPIIDIAADARRAMHENDGWQPVCSRSWDAQHSGDGRWLIEIDFGRSKEALIFEQSGM